MCWRWSMADGCNGSITAMKAYVWWSKAGSCWRWSLQWIDDCKAMSQPNHWDYIHSFYLWADKFHLVMELGFQCNGLAINEGDRIVCFVNAEDEAWLMAAMDRLQQWKHMCLVCRLHWCGEAWLDRWLQWKHMCLRLKPFADVYF